MVMMMRERYRVVKTWCRVSGGTTFVFTIKLMFARTGVFHLSALKYAIIFKGLKLKYRNRLQR